MDISEKMAIYEEVKNIVERTEASQQKKYEECLENGWMSDYTEFAIGMKLEAYEEIKSVTKD